MRKKANHLELTYKELFQEYYRVTKYPNLDRATEDCMFLYLFRNPFSGLCKIGVTNNPQGRLMQLKNASGMEVQPLIVLQCEIDYDEHPKYIESFLHKFFAAKRKFGEWFDLHIKDILEIKNLIYSLGGYYIDDYHKFFLLKKFDYKSGHHAFKRLNGVSIVNEIIAEAKK
jgi:hypothetical protein